MSQKLKKGNTPLDEKEKSRTDSPVTDMKKKAAAANSEKEKVAAEKASEKPTKETTPKSGKDAKEPPQKTSKDVKEPPQKATKDVKETPQKGKDAKDAAQKKDGPSAQSGPPVKDIPLPAEKGKDETGRVEKPKEAAPEAKPSEKTKQNGKPDNKKQNGDTTVRNGVSDVALNTNGVTTEPNTLNGTTTVSVTEIDDDDDIMIVDNDNDDLFPELTYDDTSDTDNFDSSLELTPGRSRTRRSQVKATRTPETPRPASHKQPNGDDKEQVGGAETPLKDTKLLKLKEDLTPRRLRSADRNTPEPKHDDRDNDENGDDEDKESKGEPATSSKTDTNFSKSRIKISPYRRSTRLADQTTSSMQANYTGNNTTMEMDITESFDRPSSSDDPSLIVGEESYLQGLRSIRGRRSYKPISEQMLRNIMTSRPNKSAATSEQSARPTVHVVGRKRKPVEDEETVHDRPVERDTIEPGAKRMRLFSRIASPFASLVRRRTIASVASSTPLPVRHSQPIVGINSDLPIHPPFVGGVVTEAFDPETLKTNPDVVQKAPEELRTPDAPVELAAEAQEQARQKCVVM